MTETSPLAEIDEEPETPVVEDSTSEDVSEDVSLETNEEEKNPEQLEAEKAEQEKAKGKKRLSDRNRELTYQLREEQRQRKADQDRIAKLEEATKIKSKPEPDFYDDHDIYIEDRKKWDEQERSKIREEERLRIREELQYENYQKQLDKNKDLYKSGRESYAKNNPKFHSYEEHIDFIVDKYETPEIQDLILEAGKQGPAIVSYFGANPDELEEIASLSPRQRVFRMGALTSKLEAKPVKTSSTAPPPPTSEKGGARSRTIKKTAGHDPQRESWKAYCQRRNGIT